ncbi:helix-turn-helix domain-containing protein [Haloprofundus salilacus]|uniref:helix-turn-helix domain-containing protein n=1 Tax=Haloprofundus salilacus TaxID=2876190 RepID=UPI001CCE3B31|nr:helix-turn-helix domain-containing protein [Haloprofundus salilacus]
MDASDDSDSVPDCVSEASIPTRDILEVIRCAPQPVVNTGYLAERFGVPIWAMYARLESLTEAGVLEHMEVRNRGHLWWKSFETELDEL